VTHHPFDLPENYKGRSLVGRAAMAMERLLSCGVDLLLAGHMHLSHTGHTALRYEIGGHSAIFVRRSRVIFTSARRSVRRVRCLNAGTLICGFSSAAPPLHQW
jgi:hypothetical protein